MLYFSENCGCVISIHEAYTGLDQGRRSTWRAGKYFNPRGLYRPRLAGSGNFAYMYGISIHEAYTGLDLIVDLNEKPCEISIHEAYTGLDNCAVAAPVIPDHFNPRGLYRPRRL